MSIQTILSPGVQTNEVDQSIIARSTGEINVFMSGFADQGPTDEVVNVGSISEFEQIFGTPTNAAERYFYHSAKQVLTTSPGNLLVTRMPYGSGDGAGYANKYSALVFPVSTNASTYEGATSFKVLEPKSILLSDDQYTDLLEGGVAWTTGFTASAYGIDNFSEIGQSGFVVVNNNKTTINNLFEGYYVGVADNSQFNPATDYTSLSGLKAVNGMSGDLQTYVNIPSSRLAFSLTRTFSSYTQGSISEIMESIPTFEIGTNSFTDTLVLGIFKIRTSIYEQDTVTLDYNLFEGYTGSLYANRTQNNPSGGAPQTFFLENVVNRRSSFFKVIVNPYISTTGTWLDNSGNPVKSVRIADEAKNGYAAGVYKSNTDKVIKDVGNVPRKLERVLQILDNSDTVNLDVTVDAGLSTIWTGAKARAVDFPTEPQIFDDTYQIDISELYDTSGALVGGVKNDWDAITSQYVAFADQGRKDHVFISDPLRYIFVQGSNIRASKKKDFVFSSQIYWPLRNLYASVVSSYVAAYGNIVRTNDTAADLQCWIPISGYIASAIATTAQNTAPWAAVAGFTRGQLSNVSELGITPTQKQRDLLYRIAINPIAFFPDDGVVIYGQKTMYKKPSAFDRLNVRFLFLALEKRAQEVLKYFVFEPNTFATRQRVIAALTPLFERARLSDGLYDYTIVCDERNNTPDVIDNNQLAVGMYIQAVRTAEFILADFIATRTGVNFNEIIPSGQ